jgi:hypothetical protein
MSLSRQVLLILGILGVALAMSCAKDTRKNADCPPMTNMNSPIVIVTIVGNRAVPSPDQVHANSRVGIHNGKPVPAVINWFGPEGKTLLVAMQDSGQRCVRKEVQCNGDHCHAVTNVNVKDALPPCKYRVWIEGVTLPYDPVVVVDNCCDTAI